MFKIKFKILENENYEALKNIDLAKFEHEYAGDIEGLLLLNFNRKKFGSLLLELDEALPSGIGGMDEEWLVMWLDLLNTVVKKLVFEKQLYIALKYIENSSTWIEFLVNEKSSLIVSLIELEPCLGKGRGTFADKPFETYTYGAWKNIEISIDEFAHEVINKTKELIVTINAINPILLQCKSIQELIQYVEEFEKLKQLRQKPQPNSLHLLPNVLALLEALLQQALQPRFLRHILRK